MPFPRWAFSWLPSGVASVIQSFLFMMMLSIMGLCMNAEEGQVTKKRRGKAVMWGPLANDGNDAIFGHPEPNCKEWLKVFCAYFDVSKGNCSVNCANFHCRVPGCLHEMRVKLGEVNGLWNLQVPALSLCLAMKFMILCDSISYM